MLPHSAYTLAIPPSKHRQLVDAGLRGHQIPLAGSFSIIPSFPSHHTLSILLLLHVGRAGRAAGRAFVSCSGSCSSLPYLGRGWCARVKVSNGCSLAFGEITRVFLHLCGIARVAFYKGTLHLEPYCAPTQTFQERRIPTLPCIQMHNPISIVLLAPVRPKIAPRHPWLTPPARTT
jgi:hypothetical protein